MEKSLPAIPAKRYFTIGEVSDLCGVKPYVLRYWEQEFTQLKPMKRRGNRRYYQHHEVLLIRRIRELLYDQGFTISGARNRLSDVPLQVGDEGLAASVDLEGDDDAELDGDKDSAASKQSPRAVRAGSSSAPKSGADADGKQAPLGFGSDSDGFEAESQSAVAVVLGRAATGASAAARSAKAAAASAATPSEAPVGERPSRAVDADALPRVLWGRRATDLTMDAAANSGFAPLEPGDGVAGAPADESRRPLGPPPTLEQLRAELVSIRTLLRG